MANGDLSEDVVLGEILLMLPVKSLVRFRCVSKSWYALLKSSYFVNKHTQRCNRDNNNNLIFLVTSTNYPIKSLSMLQVTRNNNNTFEHVDDVVRDHVEDHVPSLATFEQLFLPPFLWKILGPVNGVYCVISYAKQSANDDDDDDDDDTADMDNILINLCNPSLREIRALPDVPKVPGVVWSFSSIGFGYDSASINNDIKVVLYINSIKNLHGPPLVFVYTLNSTDIWRKIDTNYIDLPLSVEGDSHFLKYHGGTNGVIHWLVHSKSILSFDLGTEVFSRTSLPYPPTDSRFIICHIYHVKESLIVIMKPQAYLLRSEEWKMADYEVWKLKDYSRIGDVKKLSWSKLHNIGPILDHEDETLWSIKFLKNEEMLFYTKLVKDDEYELVLYDPSSRQQIKRHHIGQGYSVNTYKESLVSLRRG